MNEKINNELSNEKVAGIERNKERRFSLAAFKRYYYTEFDKEFMRYLGVGRHNGPINFDIRREDGFLFCLQAVPLNNKLRLSDVTKNEDFFRAALSYRVMVVHLMYCLHLSFEFCRCTGWTCISCGLGGPMHPYHTMYEMKIDPKGEEERQRLKDNMKALDEFMREDLRVFTEGEQKEILGNKDYQKIVALCKGHFDTIWQCVSEAFQTGKSDDLNKLYERITKTQNEE